MSRYSDILLLQSAQVRVDGRIVLRDIHMSIGEGEFCYLRGQSSSGKTALVYGLHGIYRIDGSIIHVCGRDIVDLSPTELAHHRRNIGLIAEVYPLISNKTVFQNLDMILSSIEWNVASDREKRISEVLDQAGLSHIQSETVNTLSYGLQKKVMIARAVLNRPKLILADSPTAGLDNKSIDEVMALLINLASEYQSSILWATAGDYLPDRYPARSYLCADGTVTEMS
ncbi:MAG: ATP-binding cassette domain-containing protein [Bacteroidota bacterium]